MPPVRSVSPTILPILPGHDPFRKPSAPFEEEAQAGVRAGMVHVAGQGIGRCGAISRTVGDIGAVLAEGEFIQGDAGSFAQGPEVRMVLPQVDQIVAVDLSEGHVPQLGAGNENAVRPDGEGLHGTRAPREGTPSRQGGEVFQAGLFPSPSTPVRPRGDRPWRRPRPG